MSYNIKCPLCNTESQQAKGSEVQRIVKKELKHLIVNQSYYFCNSPECDVVFYSKDKDNIFLLIDISFDKEGSSCGCQKKHNNCGTGNNCCGSN